MAFYGDMRFMHMWPNMLITRLFIMLIIMVMLKAYFAFYDADYAYQVDYASFAYYSV